MSYSSYSRKPLQSHAIVCAVLAGLATALAAPPKAAATELQVTIDEATLMRIDGQVSEVIVGNPSVADVSVQSSRLLVFTGKSFGATNVIVLNAQGEEIANRRVRVNAGPGRIVTLHKGTAQHSYTCNPECRGALVPGDDETFFDSIATTTRSKFGVVQSVIDESAGTPQ